MHLGIFAARQFFPEKRMQNATPGGTRPQDAGNHAFSFWREAHHRRDRNIVGVSHGGRAHTPVPSCSLPLLQAFCSRGHAAVPESAVTGAEHETFFMGAFCPAGGTAQTGTSLPLRTPLRFCRLWNVSIMTPGKGCRRHGPALWYGRAGKPCRQVPGPVAHRLPQRRLLREISAGKGRFLLH